MARYITFKDDAGPLEYYDRHAWCRDLKQARTATAINTQLNFSFKKKPREVDIDIVQLNFTVKNKPHTTNYIYCIFETYFMIKSV